MLNVWKSWLPIRPLSLMPPSPSAPPPTCNWLGGALRQSRLDQLPQAPAGLTLLAPTDEALIEAGLQASTLSPEALQRWLLGHLTLASPRQAGLLPLLNGSVLRRAAHGPGWMDAEGQPVRLLGRAQRRQQLWVQAIDRPLSVASQSLWQRVVADPSLARLTAALERCGLHQVLAASGPFTLLAPSDAGLDRAAARLGMGPTAFWQDTERLRELLLNHVVAGRWSSSDMPWSGQLRTLGNSPLSLGALGLLRSGDLSLSLSRGSDQPCSNGVLHRLTEALLPPCAEN